MLSNVLSSIDGVAQYPVISLLIFVPFFLAVAVWIVRLDRGYIQHMSRLPLEESGAAPQDTETTP